MAKVFDIMRVVCGEVPATYNGGKSGEVAAETPRDFITSTGIGIGEGATKTFDKDTAGAEVGISKKKMGTRGLQIPLVADSATTAEKTTAPGTGVQI